MAKLSVLTAMLLCMLVAVDACWYATCTGGKKYRKCELARKLISLGVARSEVAHWVCEAEYESQFCTCAVNSGTRDHGIFQINARWNCDDGGTTYNGCNKRCSAFTDRSLSDDITCMRQLLREHRNNWSRVSYGYRDNCPSIISTYLDSCPRM